jgi:AraC-like DNA-binding protein/DNA gyrase inhibitor GyrI
MNSYERIQRAIDFIEEHLTEKLDLKQVAANAYFSPSHFYRIFHALTGHSVKQYIRRRRLNEAALRLIRTNDRLIDICFDCQFGYQESFTRSFKSVFGVSPGLFRKRGRESSRFLRLDLIKQYFLPGKINTIDPKIKVLKQLPPMQVAYFRAVGKTPERDAWKTLIGWAKDKRVMGGSKPYRIFGFDNPGPESGNPIYGYEFWITVDSNVPESDKIRIKEFPGGLYAVTGTTIAEISNAWRHFTRWLKISRYKPGLHQCLEEHLTHEETPVDKMQIDLYLPIAKP